MIAEKWNLGHHDLLVQLEDTQSTLANGSWHLLCLAARASLLPPSGSMLMWNYTWHLGDLSARPNTREENTSL